MSTRQTLILGAAIVLGCLIIGASFGPLSVAQTKDVPKGTQPKKDVSSPSSAAAGRYQMMRAEIYSTTMIGQRLGDYVIVLDTATGQCWSKAAGADKKASWEDMGSPAKAKAKK
jgi:hypothetical protein